MEIIGCPGCGKELIIAVSDYAGLLEHYEPCYECECGIIVNDKGVDRTEEYYS